ncbi:MAG: hypothetical protein M0Z51_13790 [Propionibacterium sp.]|nr:hypothetical protein [Propionibacterium sp.]
MTGHELVIAAQVAEKLSRELDEDYVGLWKVAWHIRRAWPDGSDDQMRSLAASILTVLLTTGVRLGDLDADTGQFCPWPGSNSVEAAIEAWARLGRDPNIGEVAWLARLT